MSTNKTESAGYKTTSVKALYLSILIATAVCALIGFIVPGPGMQIALFIWMMAVSVLTVVFQ